MKQIKWLFAAIFVLASAAAAQDRLLTIDDIFSPVPSKRVNFSGTPTRLTWAADGRGFKQVQNGKLVRVNAITGQAEPLFDTARLRNSLVTIGIGAREAEQLANSMGLHFNQADTGIVLTHNNDLYHYDIPAGALKRLTKNAEEEKEADFSPDGKWVSFVRGNNLYVVNVASGDEKQLTRDGAEKIYNGYLDWVYQEELYGRGNFRGYWWSPDSRYIAFLRLDETKVPTFVIPNDVPNEQIVERTDYPMAGQPNPLVTIGVADVNKRSIIPNAGRLPKVNLPANVLRFGDLVQFGDLTKYSPDDLLIARVTWTPDSRAVLFQALNREQTFLDLNSMTADGKVATLFREETPAWVEVYDNPAFLGSGSTAVWQSARNGWRHLYLYDSNGKLVKPLTSGDWEVRSFYGVDPAGDWAYFAATKDSHIAQNVYRVRIADGLIERLTKGDGTHSASFNSTFTHFISNWSDANNPTQQRLFRADGTLEKVINENKVATLSEYKLGETEFFQVKTRDGFEMEAQIIRPPGFDPSKKYPVLTHVYSGPHSPSVRNAWGGSRYMWHQMLAQKGYIVWIIDNRTASGKGEQSVWPGYKNFMVLELRDIEDGVNHLKTLPYVDGDRIGIWGWSFGGMMTSYALTHSKAFKMGIAGGTVADWRLYDSIYTERYMGLPKNNPEGYDRTSVLKAAGDLSGKLLLIHGMMDDNVHMQNATQLMYEFQKAGKQFDVMLYPTQRHGVVNPAQAHHMYSLMTDYVLKNL